ncbi:hypothetical protein EGW08_014924 [Elysia chlorotica]|uniref:Small monomeric GTPase n=1 Tax=Elysia chlorotica TaxID=188477 RepID=A0A3S1B823_ELYCH|nr:hypothetical protein EGW08_014924 [Elysia chlorotica]
MNKTILFCNPQVNTTNPYILVVGNKADLAGYVQVPVDEAQMFRFSMRGEKMKPKRCTIVYAHCVTESGRKKTNGMNGKPHYNIKVAVLGEKQVGKTSLVARYTYNTFNHNYLQTKGGDITDKAIQHENKPIHVCIIDSAGHRYVRSLIKSLYREVHGILLVYDVTRRSTFEALDDWMDQISLFVQRRDLQHVECSAKTAQGVSDAFDHLIHRTLSSKLIVS